MDYLGRSYNGTPNHRHPVNGSLDDPVIPTGEELEVVDVDPTGDAIISTGTMSIRVSSHLMSQSSPVFRSMLKGRFMEGLTEGTPQNPKLTAVKEDVPDEHLLEFCRLIHHTIDDPKDFTQEEALIISLADLCAKYQCYRVAKYWVACWFNKQDRVSAEASPGLLWATHVFKLEEEFTKVSSRWAASMNNTEIESPVTR
ncbi:MAG: hypothetical protein M1824_003044 [Vezdaea acicularis]|nr:MAG: hypothetical protein M1824_003044 [Vezdaea acicularis]